MFLTLLICTLHVLSGYLTAQAVFRPANRTEAILIAGLIAYFTFYMVPIAAGSLTGYMNIWVIIFATVVSLSLPLISMHVRKIRWNNIIFPTWNTGLFRQRAPIEYLLFALGLSSVILLLIAGLQLPARTYDAVAYHMSNPVRWHLTGQFIIDSFGGVDLSAQAMSAETAPNAKAVFPFLVLLLSEEIKGTSLTQFPFLLLVMVSTRATALRLGAKPWLSTFAALTTVTVPEIFFQSLEAYSDLMFLAGEMVLLWAIINLWERPLDWRSIVFPAAGFAILSGAKAAFLFTGGVYGLFYGAILLYKWIPVKRWLTFPWLAAALCLTLLGIAMSGAPWIYNSWSKFNNPAFPFEISLGETVFFEGTFRPGMNAEVIQSYTGKEPGVLQYWDTLREYFRPPGLGSGAGGLGAGLFIVGIPSAVLFAFTFFLGTRRYAACVLFFISFFIFVITCPTLAYTRFSLFQPVMAVIAFAVLISSFPLMLRGFVMLIASAAYSYDIYMNTSAIQYRQRPAALMGFNLLSGFSRGAQLDIYPDQYTSLDFWREEVSRPELKLAIAPHTASVWHAYAPESPADCLRFRDLSNESEIVAWHREMLDAGVTHLHLRRGDKGFEESLRHPDFFKPLIKRLDSHFARKNDFWVEPYPEDALFQVVASKGAV